MSDKQRAAMTAAQNKLLGRRFCTACQRQAHPEGGVQKPNRWMCAACVHRQKTGESNRLYGPSAPLRRVV